MTWDGLAGRAPSGARLLSCYDRDSGAKYAKDTLGRVPEDDSHRYPDAGQNAGIQEKLFPTAVKSWQGP